MTKGSGIEGKTELRRAGTQSRFICGSFAIEGKRANYVKQQRKNNSGSNALDSAHSYTKI